MNYEIFSTAANLDGKDEKIKKATLLNALGSEALELYLTFNLPEETTYKEIIEAFDKYCSPKQNVVFERYKFYNRNQGHGEPFDNFFTDLKKLVKFCEFGSQEVSMIRDRIVLGVWDKSLQEKLLQVGNIDMERAAELCRASEITQEQAKMLQTAEVQFLKKDKYKSSNYNKDQKSRKIRSTQNNDNKCSRCLGYHKPKSCPAYNKKCNNCNKLNHFSKACKFKKVRAIVGNNDESCSHSEDSENDITNSVDTLYVNTVSNVSSMSRNYWTELIKVGDILVNFKLDSGSDSNIIPFKIYKKIDSTCEHMKPTTIILEAYGGQKIKPLGSANLLCEHKGERGVFPFLILNENYTSILGIETCIKLKLIQKIETIENCTVLTHMDKKDFLKKHIDSFTGIGKYKIPYKLRLRDDYKAVMNAPRRIPLKLRKPFLDTLEQLESMDIIEKVNKPVEWLNNIVIIEKKLGSLRICLSPLELNKYLIREPFVMPTLEDISQSLCGMKYFSVLDFSSGFWNVELDESSRLLTCFAVSSGQIYCFKRLPYGLSVSPEVFMRYTQTYFGELPGVFIYVDDLLVMGKTLEEHDQNLQRVLTRAKEVNVKFNPAKFQYRLQEVKYLGHIFSERGRAIDTERLRALEKLEIPTNKKELMKVLGFINYMRSYIKNLSELTAPLRKLIKKDSIFIWTNEHTKTFEKIKKCILEAPILQTFDESKDIVIESDSSQSGLGCCLLQENKPVAFASRSLSETEKQYSMIEKELLGIVFACYKFHNYIYAKDVKIKTDHKPLLSIMSKEIHKIPSAKLQRMRLKLLNYNIQLEYIPGKFMYLSDYLSRHYLEIKSEEDKSLSEVIHSINMSDEKIELFKNETSKDAVLKHLIEACKKGWPSHKSKVKDEIKFYYKLRNEIILDNGILYFKERIIVPSGLRSQMLALLHEAHLGVQKSKSRAKELLYWPNMDENIENLVTRCEVCQLNQPQVVKEPMVKPDIPNLPFNKVSCDILEYNCKYYLVLIDFYSKWIELIALKNKSSSEIINAWLQIFSRFGIPKTVVSDNVPSASNECKEFASIFNFEIITSSPHYPKGHGLAEKAVHICKNILKKAKNITDVYIGLLEYRNTPVKDLKFSPSQLLQNRLCRTKLPVNDQLLKPKLNRDVDKQFMKKIDNYCSYYNKSSKSRPDFVEENRILFLKDNKWHKGHIIKKGSTPRSYILRSDNGKIYCRNSSHIRIFKEPLFEIDEDNSQRIDKNIVESNNVNGPMYYFHKLRSGKVY